MVKTADLLKQIITQGDSFRRGRDRYIDANKKFHKLQDARITIYSRCIVTLDYGTLYLMFRNFNLPTDNWWASLPSEFVKLGLPSNLILHPSIEDRTALIETIDGYWLWSIFHLLYSSLESSIRIIVRIVYPNKFNDGRGDLTQIQEQLLSTNFSRHKDLLEFLRLTRNTIHNNGVYFPNTKGDNRRVIHHGVTYDFKDGEHVEFGGDLAHILFFKITPDLLTLVNDIVNSADVLKYPQIIDSST